MKHEAHLVSVLLYIAHSLLCVVNGVLVLQFNVALVRMNANNHLQNRDKALSLYERDTA